MPSVGNFIEKYQKLKEKYDQILSIHLSGNLSGTLNSAKLAAKEVLELEIIPIDSKSISLGLCIIIKNRALKRAPEIFLNS